MKLGGARAAKRKDDMAGKREAKKQKGPAEAGPFEEANGERAAQFVMSCVVLWPRMLV